MMNARAGKSIANVSPKPGHNSPTSWRANMRYLASSIVRFLSLVLSLSVALSREDFRFIIVCSTSCRHGIKYLLHHDKKRSQKEATFLCWLYGQWECHKRWPIRCGCELRMPMCELPMQCGMRTLYLCVSVGICVWVSLWRL